MAPVLPEAPSLDFEGIMQLKHAAREQQVRSVYLAAPEELDRAAEQAKAALRGHSVSRRQRMASYLAS